MTIQDLDFCIFAESPGQICASDQCASPSGFAKWWKKGSSADGCAENRRGVSSNKRIAAVMHGIDVRPDGQEE